MADELTDEKTETPEEFAKRVEDEYDLEDAESASAGGAEDETTETVTEDAPGDDDDDKGADETETESELDPELIEMAKDAGIDESEARKFDDPVKLAKHILDVNKEATVRESKSQETKSDDDAKPDDDDFKLELDDDLIDPDVKEAMEKLHKHYSKKTSDAHEAIADLRAELQARDASAAQDQFDKFLNGLGDEWQDVFGKGSASDLDPKSKEFDNRSKVWSEVMERARSAAKKGKSIEADKLFQSAVHATFGDELEKITQKGLSKKLKKQSKRMTARPDSRTATTKDVSPDAEANAFVRQWMRDHEDSLEDPDLIMADGEEL